MQKIKIVVLFLALFNFTCKTEVELDPTLTKEFFISSKAKGKDYRIWVQLPKGYETSTQKYPTMYVLDPDSDNGDGTDLSFMAKWCQKLSEEKNTQNVILIGIRYGDFREVDYTPTAYTSGGAQGLTGYGEAPVFLKFIKEELIPKVEKDYKVETSRAKRTIIGHSLAGLCGAYAFAKHNEIFENYLLLSPTLMYDHEIVLVQEQEERSKINKNAQLVYLGVGGLEGNMFPPIDIFQQRLEKHYPNAKSTFFINSGKGHNSSKNENFEKAIQYYFENRK